MAARGRVVAFGGDAAPGRLSRSLPSDPNRSNKHDGQMPRGASLGRIFPQKRQGVGLVGDGSKDFEPAVQPASAAESRFTSSPTSLSFATVFTISARNSSRLRIRRRKTAI